MKILHYSLGFPPYRSGGLTKFCTDLMEQQRREGDEVALLWPGSMDIRYPGKPRIKQHKEIKGIGSFELINPTPVPYDEGIADPSLFLAEGDKEIYDLFLDNLKPDVIHIHTFMGIHYSFIESAKKRQIRLVFTAHDFFPLCTKVTLFKNGKICNTYSYCSECHQCNRSALPVWKIKLLQSALYREVKDTAIVSKLRAHHRNKYLGVVGVAQTDHKTETLAEDYMELRRHFCSILEMMDVIHYNSSLTKSVYQRIWNPQAEQSVVISITHSGISTHTELKTFDNSLLRITFLGAQSEAKGYYLLTKALDEIQKSGKKFVLNVPFVPTEPKIYINSIGRYSSGQIKDIMERTDVLVAPSVCFETFGFTVLEALSFGVPVIVSDCVGAKEIIPEGGGMVFDHTSVRDLISAFNAIDVEMLRKMNRNIVNATPAKTIDRFSDELKTLVYSGLALYRTEEYRL